MRNDKQSSIDLFIDQLEEKGNAYEENEGGRTINISIDISDYMELKIQAKAMHKEEIEKVSEDWWNEGASYMYDGQRKYNSFEQYYNETYGGNNEQQTK